MAGPDNSPFQREGNNFDGLAQIENPSHRRRRVRFTGVGTHERLSVPRRLSSPPPPYTLNWDPQTIQTLVAQLDNLQVQLQDQGHLLAALEMETEKHIKIAVKKEVISHLLFSFILAVGLVLVLLRLQTKPKWKFRCQKGLNDRERLSMNPSRLDRKWSSALVDFQEGREPFIPAQTMANEDQHRVPTFRKLDG
ncbi:hypothetical protein B0H14DRAFT_3128308 [Mycena olivaceomarginata]|nr:hypothetical protein B0H14DRAFT_3128308 [Mycena olivaceomarginata]